MTDIFRQGSTIWRRVWVGDNSGRYEWTSDDGRLICWREGRDYSASMDGYPATKSWPTLTAAMAATTKAREAYDRKRQAA